MSDETQAALVALALKHLSRKVIIFVAEIATIVLFGYAALYPDTPRIAVAAGFAGLVFLPLVWENYRVSKTDST